MSAQLKATLKVKNKYYLFLFFIYFFSNNYILANVFAELRAIDRTTGRTFILEAPINRYVMFSNLQIRVKYCYKNPIDKKIENYAYLEIKDKILNEYLFEGWMFSSSPSLSSLEHPINDIWLLNCKKIK